MGVKNRQGDRTMPACLYPIKYLPISDQIKVTGRIWVRDRCLLDPDIQPELTV